MDSKEYQRIDSDEKDALLFVEEQKGVSINVLFGVYAILIFSLLFCLPKIYLTSNIYYVSRDIDKLQTQQTLLKEENNRLERELEDVKFKYLMMNLD
ncbi:hypothetical protein [Helicobacter sp. 13S00477-4]|uniref:hypothetical protein n=1 Tax=Helicobacter sp. 13S00477-4 TaxID=1905759 RepID=UPI000BDDA812|nr:hypothetical protein [Helicobacter sp. 13S00477-4]PAF52175.1 hypothetical protein BKH44_03485 [Helicobacter sp. 13S00477-4]